MKQSAVDAVKHHLDAVLARAREGGTVISPDDDGKACQLVSTIVPENGTRKAGLLKGQIKFADEFFEPLPNPSPACNALSLGGLDLSLLRQ